MQAVAFLCATCSQSRPCRSTWLKIGALWVRQSQSRMPHGQQTITKKIQSALGVGGSLWVVDKTFNPSASPPVCTFNDIYVHTNLLRSGKILTPEQGTNLRRTCLVFWAKRVRRECRIRGFLRIYESQLYPVTRAANSGCLTATIFYEGKHVQCPIRHTRYIHMPGEYFNGIISTCMTWVKINTHSTLFNCHVNVEYNKIGTLTTTPPPFHLQQHRIENQPIPKGQSSMWY